MDKYSKALTKHRRKEWSRKRTRIIIVCSMALGYVLGNLSCLAVLMV